MLPTPGSLSSQTRPLIKSTNRRQIVSPTKTRVQSAPAWAADLSCPGPEGSSCEKADVGFVPRYPDPATAPDYGVFIATLPGLGYLSDGEGAGRLYYEG